MLDSKENLKGKIDEATNKAKGWTQEVSDRARATAKGLEGSTAGGIVEAVKDQVQAVATGASGLAGMAKDTAQEWASSVGDAAVQAKDKAKDGASNVFDKTKETVSAFGQKAQDATHAVGRGMESLAGTVRQNLPRSGAVGTAASSVASGLESGGQYLEKEGLEGIGEDVLNLIRRNPLPAMLVGIGLGYILARATSARS